MPPKLKAKLKQYLAARELVEACEALDKSGAIQCDDAACCGSGVCPRCKARQAWWRAVVKAKEAGL